MNDLANARIGLIGTGAIGSALIDRLVNGLGIGPDRISACEADDAKRADITARFGVRVDDNPLAAAKADIIVIAVPPPAVQGVMSAMSDHLAHQPVIISFAAALSVNTLESYLPYEMPVIRVNPNSPSLVGHGYNPVVYGSYVGADKRALADLFLGVLGSSVEVADDKMNLYTALTAVGPTYFLPVFQALVSLGMENGLSREEAVSATVQTAQGVASMVGAREEDPDQLKLFTGLRPLKDEDVRDMVKAAASDALGRMTALEAKMAGG